jgi:hypothetical protein
MDKVEPPALVLEQKAAKLAAKEARLQRSVLGSTSWQITSPIRKFHELFPRTGKFLILIIQLVGCTLTIKLHRKLTFHQNQRSREKAVKRSARTTEIATVGCEGTPREATARKFDDKIGLENLAIARNVLMEFGVRYFLTDGTLLGLVREGKFIDHDSDLDVGLFAEDFDLVTFCLCVSKLIDKGFIPEWGECNRSFGRSFVFAGSRNGVKLDLKFYVRRGDLRILQCAYDRIQFSFPASMVEPLCPVKFLGEIFMVPKNREAMLAHQYGDWKTPRVDWDWSVSPLNIVRGASLSTSFLQLGYRLADSTCPKLAELCL